MNPRELDSLNESLAMLGKDELYQLLKDTKNMKAGDVTMASIACGIGRKTKNVKGGKGFVVVNSGCKWRTKKGEEAWYVHVKKAHPRLAGRYA